MKIIYELKTTSEDIGPGSMYWRKLTLDGQVSGYLAAEPDAEGCLYDVIRKTALRPTGKGLESEESYHERILAQITEDPTRYFQRGTITRTKEEIVDYHRDMVGTSAMITWARDRELWPRQVSSCTKWNSTCDYWEVCANGADIQDTTMFEQREQMGKSHLPVLSASAVATWRDCPRKYLYAYEQRYRARREPSHAMSFGKAVHAMIQAYHVGPETMTTPGGTVIQMTGLDRGHRIANEMAPGHDRGHARALLLGYDAMFGASSLRLSQTEREFFVPLTDPDSGRTSSRFVLGGYIDGVGEVE